MSNEMTALAQVYKAVFSAVHMSKVCKFGKNWAGDRGWVILDTCDLDAGVEIQAPGGGNLAELGVERGNLG